MGNEMVIATSADKGYEQHTSVMLASLFANTRNTRFRIFLLCSEYSSAQLRLIKFAKRKGHFLELIRLNEDSMQSFKVTEHISLATYYRLFIPNVIPKNIKKLLYLDSDMVILGDLNPLWKMNIDNYLGAAREMPGKFDRFASLELMSDHAYFNAGVILLNLEKIRQMPFTEIAIEYMNRKYSEIQWWDQDVLNYVMQGKIKLLDDFWHTLSTEPLGNMKINILHYAGSIKPWRFAQHNKRDKYYFRYLAYTPWWYRIFTNRSYLSIFIASLKFWNS
jgi:lipopolysaccharide biosynthesis glycosyltransferase